MSEKYKYESGAIHLDHHKELHLGKVSSTDAKDLMREFFEREVEDVDVYEEVIDGLAEIQEEMKELKVTKKVDASNKEMSLTSEEKIRQCIFLLMNERIMVKKNGKNMEEPLFNLQNHWQAIYRILVDKKYCKDSDFEGFDLFIKKVIPDEVNAPYKKSSVKQISQTDFNKPFERMKAVAQRFLEILEEKGL